MSGGRGVEPLREALELVGRSDLAERCEGVSRLASHAGEDATHALVALLEEPSWYLRDRVVEALAERVGASAAILRVLHQGSWFARASACDALGRLAEPESLPHLLRQAEDRNVSVQKSAVAALVRVAGEAGDGPVARAIAALPAERRRRVTARIGHQAPRWIDELNEALAKLPAEAFAAATPAPAPVSGPAAGSDASTLVRFRKWLAGLPVGEGS